MPIYASPIDVLRDKNVIAKLCVVLMALPLLRITVGIAQKMGDIKPPKPPPGMLVKDKVILRAQRAKFSVFYTPKIN